jgi:phospholipase A1
MRVLARPCRRGATALVIHALALLALSFLTVPLSAQGQAEPAGTEDRYWGDCLTGKLSTFRKNYVLPLAYDPDLSEAPSSEPTGENRDAEVEFQISLRYALTDPHRRVPGQLFLAYTSVAHWQVYDTEGSSPFRTTDHEPELFWEWYMKGDLGLRCGVSHQSNGEGGNESRSWNRVYVEGLWNGVERWEEREGNEWGLALKVWDAFDVANNNEDITDYMGHFELRTDWTLPFGVKHGNLLSALLRRDLDDDWRGAVELGYSRDFIGRSRIYLQYFAGYGESLLEYNEYAQRIGIGFEFSP